MPTPGMGPSRHHLSPLMECDLARRENTEKHTLTKGKKLNIYHIDEADMNENHSSSPSKEELKLQNSIMKCQIRKLEIKQKTLIARKKGRGGKDIDLVIGSNKEYKRKAMKCQDCEKTFLSAVGLSKHRKIHHKENIDKLSTFCNVCGQYVVYLDQHVKRVHSHLARYFCDICQHIIKTDVKKHRGQCVNCPICKYVNKKRHRLMRHILKKHGQDRNSNQEQEEPLDLSPTKKSSEESKVSDLEEVSPSLLNIESSKKSHPVINVNMSKGSSLYSCCEEEVSLSGTMTGQDVSVITSPDITTSNVGVDNGKEDLDQSKHDEAQLSVKQQKYSFDEDNDLFYISEFEDNDTDEYTKNRKKNKVLIQKRLSEVDMLVSSRKGHKDFEDKFKTFMDIKTNGKPPSDDNSLYVLNKGTALQYSRYVGNDILPAFSRCYDPFKPSWLLDPITKKSCRYNGEDRLLVDETAPIYFTKNILQEALKRYESPTGDYSSSSQALLNASVSFMDFIEFEFGANCPLYGLQPLQQVKQYHDILRNFIKSSGAWKMAYNGKIKADNEKKILNNILNPNEVQNIIENYDSYKGSSERQADIDTVLHYACQDSLFLSQGRFLYLSLQYLISEGGFEKMIFSVYLTLLFNSELVGVSHSVVQHRNQL